jgi:hypothetical protein
MGRTAAKAPTVAPGGRVVIGMDPHKRSVTVEVMGADEQVLGGGRYATDVEGCQALMTFAKRWPQRVWAIEGSQLHHLLLELIPGGAKKDLSTRQAKALLATVRPRDAAGKTRHRVAAELIGDLERIYARRKAANRELTDLVAATGTGLLTSTASDPPAWPGCSSRSATAPGSRTRRLRVLHIMARVQIRNPSLGRTLRPQASRRQSTMEAMRCVKRRLSDTVYQQMLNDAMTHTTPQPANQQAAGPGGHRGTSTDSSVTGSHPHDGSSEKSLPGPPLLTLRRPCPPPLDTERSHDRADRGSMSPFSDPAQCVRTELKRMMLLGSGPF